MDGSHQEEMRDLQAFTKAHPGFALAVGGLKNNSG